MEYTVGKSIKIKTKSAKEEIRIATDDIIKVIYSKDESKYIVGRFVDFEVDEDNHITKLIIDTSERYNSKVVEIMFTSIHSIGLYTENNGEV